MRQTRSSSEPVLTRAARDLGINPRSLQGADWRQVYWGVHVVADVELDVGVRARAGLLLHPVPDAHLSHSTVAQLHGIPVPLDDEIHVTVHDRADRRYRPGLRPHFRAAASSCARLRGMPVSDSLQLFVELSATLPLVDAVVAGDHMVRTGFFSCAELMEFCRELRGKHVRKSRRAARLVRDGVESPMETRLRLLLVFAGLPEPVVNYVVRVGGSAKKRRLDLSFPRWRLAIEYDGRHHIQRMEQWQADIDRREELDGQHWRVIVITADGVFRDPQRTIRRVRDALRSCGVKLRPADESWRAHFPPR